MACETLYVICSHFNAYHKLLHQRYILRNGVFPPASIGFNYHLLHNVYYCVMNDADIKICHVITKSILTTSLIYINEILPLFHNNII